MNDVDRELLVFKALSDPLRIRLLRAISEKDSVCVCELTKHICALQSKLSYHLKMLLEAELIDVFPNGKWNFYKIRLTTFERILSLETMKKILEK
ncbi:MAG: putative transcriptional regulator [Firmicutes bacterium]|nr:putative transcriptional regulator [Bacillota bacterium]